MFKKNGILVNNNIEKLSNNNCNGNEKSNNNNNNGNTQNNLIKNRICRDFMRGYCRRNQCKYPHVLSSNLVIFCHDYQNTNCNRNNCKFLHYTLEEEDYYKKYGEFPLINDNYVDNNDDECTTNLINDNNKCNHHRDCCLTNSSDTIRLRKNIKDLSIWNNNNLQCRTNERLINDCHDEYQNLKRKSYIDSIEVDYKRFRNNTNPNDNDNQCIHKHIDALTMIRRLDEEQTMLRRRVEANELKIAELRANNEYLMSQNAQLRINNHINQHQSQQSQPQQQQLRCSVTQSVTQTSTHQQTPQVMTTGVSIAPVQVQATPIVSIATPQTQIITNSGTPLSITASNTSQGQQLAISQQNITSLSNGNQPAAILGTSQITLAPGINQGPSMGLTINTSQALAMSNATQPIISYPIMTHSILPH